MRAIDADAFKEYITEACEDLAPLFNDNGKVARLVTENFCKDIDEQPTIQPEIVRCEECKYHYQRNCPIEKYFSLDGFCSRGKRREVSK